MSKTQGDIPTLAEFIETLGHKLSPAQRHLVERVDAGDFKPRDLVLRFPRGRACFESTPMDGDTLLRRYEEATRV